MPQCAFHPGVETEMRCAECERYICPKDMVLTPVGYKCRECARPAKSQYRVVKPGQFLRALLAGGAVGIGGGIIMSFLAFGFFGIILGFIWGSATAEAARRASGGHREWSVGIVAVGAIAIGFFLGGAIGPGANWLAAIVAVLAALSNLALLGSR